MVVEGTGVTSVTRVGDGNVARVLCHNYFSPNAASYAERGRCLWRIQSNNLDGFFLMGYSNPFYSHEGAAVPGLVSLSNPKRAGPQNLSVALRILKFIGTGLR